MNHFGNFGIGLGQSIPGGTMINPFFDLWGPFMADRVRNVTSMVAYYPAQMHRKKKGWERVYGMDGAARRGFVGGYIGPVSGAPRAIGR